MKPWLAAVILALALAACGGEADPEVPPLATSLPEEALDYLEANSTVTESRMRIVVEREGENSRDVSLVPYDAAPDTFATTLSELTEASLIVPPPRGDLHIHSASWRSWKAPEGRSLPPMPVTVRWTWPEAHLYPALPEADGFHAAVTQWRQGLEPGGESRPYGLALDSYEVLVTAEGLPAAYEGPATYMASLILRSDEGPDFGVSVVAYDEDEEWRGALDDLLRAYAEAAAE